MKTKSIRSGAFIIGFCLLLGAKAFACIDPPCPPCQFWYALEEECVWSCSTCCNDECCDTSDCKKCENDVCVSCKCWYPYTPISGSITVHNAKLCEQKTHTSSISDIDYWRSGDGSEGYPSDSLTYSWSKNPGSNPQSGEWKSGTTDPNVVWQAPPRIGTVNIKLTANDVPNSMDDPCPGSSRDDSPKDFLGSLTVSLPDGCSECEEYPIVIPSITEDTSCTRCGDGKYGYVRPYNIPLSHPYTLKTPCYLFGAWYPYLESVDTIAEICRSCPDNPQTVVCLGDVEGMTKQEACEQLAKYPNDPLLIEDMFTTGFEDNCWCRDCVADHEETHLYIDWVQNSLQYAIDEFARLCSLLDINIDCGNPNSVDCATALTEDDKNLLEYEWDRAFWNAWLYLYNDPYPEANARAAERDCYQEIIDALIAKCNS